MAPHLPIGEALVRARTRRGLSQRQLMNRLGWGSHTYLSAVENNRVNPTIGQLDLLASALDVPLWRLVRYAQRLKDRRLTDTVAGD